MPTVPSRRAIIERLRDHSVPIDTWGTENRRSLDDFVCGLTRDQVFFRDDSTFGLTIDVHAVIVVVTHEFKRRWLELYEDRQVFFDGSVLRRKEFNGIAETLKRGEILRDGAIRCLAEELQFHDQSSYTLSKCVRTEHLEPKDSEKWPGIKASYHRHLFECVVSRHLYRREGYAERGVGRTIFFKWKPRGQTQFRF